jgi:hypothetical protein
MAQAVEAILDADETLGLLVEGIEHRQLADLGYERDSHGRVRRRGLEFESQSSVPG